MSLEDGGSNLLQNISNTASHPSRLETLGALLHHDITSDGYRQTFTNKQNRTEYNIHIHVQVHGTTLNTVCTYIYRHM